MKRILLDILAVAIIVASICVASVLLVAFMTWLIGVAEKLNIL